MAEREEVFQDDEIDLIELFQIFWAEKLLIVIITAICSALGVTYALLATSWYKSEVTLAPTVADPMSGITAQLGGLASLAGIGGIGGSAGDRSVEAIATLQSRELAREFIRDHGLVQKIFHKQWDDKAGRWKAEDPKDWPDERDAVKFFREDMLSVSQDRKTQLITLSFTWTDPEEAATWASELVARVNSQMGKRAEVESEDNLRYLNEELSRTKVVTLQQSVSRLIEVEMQKLMMARNSDDYAVRTIDAAQVPKRRERPKRALIAVASTLAGGMLALLWVGGRHAFRQYQQQSEIRRARANPAQ
jgi:uncharacterized protein involved in exopolysaccharide biosynthesis